MLFTQNNVYTKVRFTHEFVNDIVIDFVEWQMASISLRLLVNFHYISLQGNRDSGAAFEGKKQQLAFEMSEIGKDHILPSEKI